MRAFVLAVGALATLAGTARADGYYVTEDFGILRARGALAERVTGTDLRARVALGVRYGTLAVEGWFAQAQDIHASLTGPTDPTTAQLAMFGVDLRLVEPIAPHLATYVHAGASRLYLSSAMDDDYTARGLGGGVGLAVTGRVRALGFLWAPLFFTQRGPLIRASAFVDTGIDGYRDGALSNVMLGFAVGSDF